jgi:hypothetical protein
LRGAPGNAINHTMSLLDTRTIPSRCSSTRSMSCPRPATTACARWRTGVALARDPPRRFQPRCVRLQHARQPHAPRVGTSGVTVDQVVESTTFELVIDGTIPETRQPTDDELRIIREVIDPQSHPQGRVQVSPSLPGRSPPAN